MDSIQTKKSLEETLEGFEIKELLDFIYDAYDSKVFTKFEIKLMEEYYKSKFENHLVEHDYIKVGSNYQKKSISHAKKELIKTVVYRSPFDFYYVEIANNAPSEVKTAIDDFRHASDIHNINRIDIMRPSLFYAQLGTLSGCALVILTQIIQVAQSYNLIESPLKIGFGLMSIPIFGALGFFAGLAYYNSEKSQLEIFDKSRYFHNFRKNYAALVAIS